MSPSAFLGLKLSLSPFTLYPTVVNRPLNSLHSAWHKTIFYLLFHQCWCLGSYKVGNFGPLHTDDESQICLSVLKMGTGWPRKAGGG